MSHFEKFNDWNPRKSTLTLVNNALEAYEVMKNYDPTLRTLFYQLVSDGHTDNTNRAYKNLGNTLRKARDAGLFPWDALSDNNRTYNAGWRKNDTVEELISDLTVWLNIWEGQENYVEVWVEKDAQAGTVRSAVQPYRCHWMACKGYLSATMAYDAGQRFKTARRMGKKCHLIHLGDHDPSGIDMTRDNSSRILKYSRGWMDDLETHRIALTRDQVDEYNPPANGIDTGFKENDPRAIDYIPEHGMVSWELDALKPKILVPIIQSKLENLIDMDKMNERKKEEEEAGEELDWITNNCDEVLEFVREQMEY